MNLFKDLWEDNFLKEGTNEIHWGKVISSLIVVLALVTFGIYKNADLKKKAKERFEYRRYTIGITGEWRHNLKSSQPTVKYYYTVLGKDYQGLEHIGATYEKTVIANGGRYWVEFSYKDPSNSKLLLGQPVPNSIRNAPDSGWADIIVPRYP